MHTDKISKDDGQVYSCGYGALGLGNGKIETLEPMRVQIDEKVVKIFAVQDMAAAISGMYSTMLQCMPAKLTPYTVMKNQGNCTFGVLVVTPVV